MNLTLLSRKSFQVKEGLAVSVYSSKFLLDTLFVWYAEVKHPELVVFSQLIGFFCKITPIIDRDEWTGSVSGVYLLLRLVGFHRTTFWAKFLLGISYHNTIL